MELPIAANDNEVVLYYVYVWSDADGTPFYVGKGRKRRAFDTYKRSAEFNAVYEQGGCTVEIVDWFMLESQALAYEIELIERYGRRDYGGTLVNRTDGGEGSVGHIKTPESIAVWRSKNVGRKRSPDVGARISAAKMGHTVSAEAKARMSAAQMKRFEDPAAREYMRSVALNMTPETRARMSASAIRRAAEPTEGMLRARLAAVGRPVDAEVRTKISAALFGVPKSENTVEAMRAASRMKPPRGRYKGVSLDKNKWRAIICIDGVNRSLGSYADPSEAALAYDKAAIAAWGYGNCYLNQPVANDNDAALAA